MRKSTTPDKVFTRRAVLLGLGQGALAGALVTRLGYLQLVEASKYKTLSDKNRINLKILPPSRGEIFDRHGEILATNTQSFRMMVIPEKAKDLRESLSRLQTLYPLGRDKIQDIMDQARKLPAFVPIEVVDGLSWDSVAEIEVNLPELPGVSIDVGERRYYPLRKSTGHLIGYVGAVSEEEQKRDSDRLLKLPGFKIGKTGLEYAAEDKLRGKAGTAQIEVNVSGREIRELKKIPAKQGNNLTLTIDAALQDFVQKRLEEERSGSAVVMDSHTGEVYAMASNPAFDPNLFVRGISRNDWNALREDIAHPLIFKAVSGIYPPGSTFKMVTAMAALETGHVNAQKTFFCPGHFELGNQKFHCWQRGGHGQVDLRKALRESCDVYFYNLATEMGIDVIAAMARRLGLGERFALELAEQKTGLIPTQRWKRSRYGSSWRQGDTINASIGQGYVQTTPLQLAVMTSRLVNGGRAVQPWMTYRDGQRPQPQWEPVRVNQAHLKMVVEAMNDVTLHRRGTAHGSRILEPGMEMGGKTGTAQVKRITKEERAAGIKNEDLEWQLRHHALFVGYAPLSNPRYVASVVIDHGEGGGKTAAPAARDILLKAQQLNPAKIEFPVIEKYQDTRGREETVPTQSYEVQRNEMPQFEQRLPSGGYNPEDIQRMRQRLNNRGRLNE